MNSFSESMHWPRSITSSTRVAREELQMRAAIASPLLKMLTTLMLILQLMEDMKATYSNGYLTCPPHW